MKFADCFAGVGGFHTALARLGHQCVFASEIIPHLQQLYHTNYNIQPHGDITKINPNSIPDHDILTGGFPCQTFSKAGKQQGMNDPRGNMIFTIANILRIKQPDYFILENVPQLLTINNGETYQAIKGLLMDTGYDVIERIYCPTDFGIPQLRKRVFILGSKSNLTLFQWPEPTHKESDLSINTILDKSPDPATLVSPIIKSYITAWADYCKQFSPVPRQITNPNDPVIQEFPKSRRHIDWQTTGNNLYDNILSIRQSGLRVKSPTSFPALTRTHMPIIPSQYRTLSAMEMARLQSMQSLKQLPTQAQSHSAFGNGVNAEVVYQVATALFNHIDSGYFA